MPPIKLAGREARPTVGQAELGKNQGVPKYNLGTRREGKNREGGRPRPPIAQTGSLCHQYM
jgi:hypothetical protein